MPEHLRRENPGNMGCGVATCDTHRCVPSLHRHPEEHCLHEPRPALLPGRAQQCQPPPAARAQVLSAVPLQPAHPVHLRLTCQPPPEHPVCQCPPGLPFPPPVYEQKVRKRKVLYPTHLGTAEGGLGVSGSIHLHPWRSARPIWRMSSVVVSSHRGWEEKVRVVTSQAPSSPGFLGAVKTWLNGQTQRMMVSGTKSGWRPVTSSTPGVNTGSTSKGHEVAEGTGASLLNGKAERAETLQLAHEKAQGDLPCREGAKGMEPVSDAQCQGPEAMGTNLNTGEPI